MESISSAITAIATAVMAIFTIVLALVSRTQARLTRETLVSTERAFVFLEDFDRELTIQPGSRPQVTRLTLKPRWKNAGTTPTKNMRVAVNWTPWGGPLPHGFPYTCETPVRMFLGPQATEWSAPVEIDPGVVNSALKGEQRIYVWGRVDYEDIFPETPKHFTEWCYRLHIVARDGRIETQFIAEGDHNRSDEDRSVKRINNDRLQTTISDNAVQEGVSDGEETT